MTITEEPIRIPDGFADIRALAASLVMAQKAAAAGDHPKAQANYATAAKYINQLAHEVERYLETP